MNKFKKGNYLKCSWNNRIIKVIIENATVKDLNKYFYYADWSPKNIFIAQHLDGRYYWFHKYPKSFNLIPYMNNPLWKVLNE